MNKKSGKFSTWKSKNEPLYDCYCEMRMKERES